MARHVLVYAVLHVFIVTTQLPEIYSKIQSDLNTLGEMVPRDTVLLDTFYYSARFVGSVEKSHEKKVAFYTWGAHMIHYSAQSAWKATANKPYNCGYR